MSRPRRSREAGGAAPDRITAASIRAVAKRRSYAAAKGGHGAVGLPGDRDLAAGRQAPQRARRREQARDDEADVTRLVVEIALVGTAGRIRALDREDRRRDDVPGACPRIEQAPVDVRGQREPMSEDDERKRRVAARRIAHVGHQHARSGCCRRGSARAASGRRAATREDAPGSESCRAAATATAAATTATSERIAPRLITTLT